MVEIDEACEALPVIDRPLKDCFSPRHAEVVVQFAMLEQTALGGIPQRFARLSASERFPRQAVAWVCGMLGKRRNRPGWKTCVRFQFLSVVAKRIRQFSPDQEFIKILFGTVSGSFPRNTKRRDHSIMKVRRHSAHAVDFDLIATFGIPAQSFFPKGLPACIPRLGTAARLCHRSYRVIDCALRHHAGDTVVVQNKRCKRNLRRHSFRTASGPRAIDT